MSENWGFGPIFNIVACTIYTDVCTSVTKSNCVSNPISLKQEHFLVSFVLVKCASQYETSHHPHEHPRINVPLSLSMLLLFPRDSRVHGARRWWTVSQSGSDSVGKSILRRWHAMKISRVSTTKLAARGEVGNALNEAGVSPTQRAGFALA